jgi:hypothetical protein
MCKKSPVTGSFEIDVFPVFWSGTHVWATTDMPALRKIPALLRAKCIYTTEVVLRQETTGAAELFGKTELGPVSGNNCMALNKIFFTYSECRGQCFNVLLRE